MIENYSQSGNYHVGQISQKALRRCYFIRCNRFDEAIKVLDLRDYPVTISPLRINF